MMLHFKQIFNAVECKNIRIFEFMRGKRKGEPKKRTRSDLSTKGKRAVAIKKRRAAAPKTRASNTLSEGEYWQMIRAALRNRTRFWKPKLDALKKARRPSQSANKRLKWEYKCSKCGNWFPQKNIEAHHTHPAGQLNNSDDLKAFVDKLFCEEDGFQITCKPCHRAHHAKH